MLKDWKTTVVGFAAAVLNLWASGVTLKSAVVSVSLATLGSVAGDTTKKQ